MKFLQSSIYKYLCTSLKFILGYVLSHKRRYKRLTGKAIHFQQFTPQLLQRTTASSSSTLHAANAEPFTVTVDLPGEGLAANMKFPPVLDVPSEIVEVRYAVPFGLDVAPKEGLAVCTKDGVSQNLFDIILYLYARN